MASSRSTGPGRPAASREPHGPADRSPVPGAIGRSALATVRRRSRRGAAAGVIGNWYSGTSSSIGYVDPGSGSYSDGGSEGNGYTFQPDGTWQFGYLLTSALYSCQMKVLVFNQGEITSSDTDTHLTELHADRSQVHSEDTCSAAENYDKELVPADETLIWQRMTDEYGDVLMLRHPRHGLLRLPPDAIARLAYPDLRWKPSGLPPDPRSPPVAPRRAPPTPGRV